MLRSTIIEANCKSQKTATTASLSGGRIWNLDSTLKLIHVEEQDKISQALADKYVADDKVAVKEKNWYIVRSLLKKG